MPFGIRSLLLFLWTFDKYVLAYSQLIVDTPKHFRCDQTKTLSDTSGKFDYYGQYSTKNLCLFFPADGDSTLTISFMSFEFGYQDEHGNCTNFVAIGSSAGFSSKRYCGSRAPQPYHSGPKDTWIWVHTDYTLRDSLFILYYSKVSACGGDVDVPLYTFIAPQLPYEQDAADSPCTWKVSAKNVPLQFQLNLWRTTPYPIKLRIYDGDVLSSNRILAEFDENTDSDLATSRIFTTTQPLATVVYEYYPSYNYLDSYAIFNLTAKVKGYCLPDTYSCGDGTNCYNKEQKCDRNRDCTTGYDELGCGGCPSSQFWCGVADENCYTKEQYCNGMKDCETNIEDEKNCESCGPGSFLCSREKQCIYERWRCDGDYDCHDHSDEEGCPYSASRRVITAAVIGSLVCSLLLVIALGCTCKLYSLRAAHHRHPHHQYRATPLTRVEREIFQRQAPPTYDMTIDGGTTDTPQTSRQQRQRRHRSRRRYQFQRSMPANELNLANENSRTEEIQSPVPQTQSTTPSTVATTPTQASSQTPVDANVRHSVASFVFENVPEILAEMIFTTRNQAGQVNGSGGAVRSSTPQPIVTRDSGTQTNPNSPRTSTSSTQPTSTSTTAGSSSYSSRRSEGSSSRSRSRRRGAPSNSMNSNSKEQQAKPLPKKKKIQPVMVPAPCPDSLIEDTLTCVYPCPPSYSQAVASGSPPLAVNVLISNDPNGDESFSNSPNSSFDDPPTPPTQDSVFVSPKITKTKFPFSFSLSQALRNIASSPFTKFQKNPYSQMESLENISPNTEEDSSSVNIEVEEQNPAEPNVLEENQSNGGDSDDELINCVTNSTSDPLTSADPYPEVNSVTTTNESNLVKVFPSKKKSGATIRPEFQQNEQNNSLELSDFSFSEDV